MVGKRLLLSVALCSEWETAALVGEKVCCLALRTLRHASLRRVSLTSWAVLRHPFSRRVLDDGKKVRYLKKTGEIVD